MRKVLHNLKYIAYFSTVILTLLSIVLAFNVRLKETLLFSVSYYLSIYFIFLALTAKPFKALNIASICYVILYAVHRIKIHFYKEPLFFSDLYVMFDPNNWDTIFQYQEGWAILLFVALALFALIAYRKTYKVGYKTRMISLVLCFILVGFNVYLAQNQKIRNIWLSTLPEAKETFMNFTMSASSVSYVKPTYPIDNSFEVTAIPDDQLLSSENKPNIILWLQESTLDVSLISDKIEKPQMYQSADNLKSSSLLRVHTYGGRTYRSEFGLLSGINPNYFKEHVDAVFYTVTSHLKYSLPKFLKKQGYKTIVLSPFNGGSYNAQKAYQDLGIDIYYQPQDFGYPAKKSQNLWKISSLEMAKYAEKVLEKHKNDGPIFLYMLTMAEHGPYDENYPIINELNKEFDPKTASKISDYVMRQHDLDKATTQFDDYLHKHDNNYIFAYFGDHQGALNNATVQAKNTNFRPLEFLTQVYIRGSSNIAPIALNPVTDISLVSGVILDLAKLPKDEFFQANSLMRKRCNGLVNDCDAKIEAGYISYLFNTIDAGGN